MSYNGWTNRETWNASLWINNEEPLYRLARSIAREGFEREYKKIYTAGNLANAMYEIWPDGKTPDGDLLKNVDWLDVLNGLSDFTTLKV